LDYDLLSRYLLVINFCSSAASYVAYCQDNFRLDIAKCRNYLPPDVDPEEHFHYMWVHAVQGFFLLRQRVRGRLNEEWYIIGEIVPHEFSSYFFEEAWENFEELLKRFHTTFPYGGVSILDLAPLERLGADLGL